MKNKVRMHRGLLLWLILPTITIWYATNYVKTTPLQASENAMSEFRDYKFENQHLEPKKWDGKGKVTLWFDDAWETQYSIAYPLLEKYGYKGVVAVPTRHIGYEAYLSWLNIAKLKYMGWEITAHSRNHNCDVDSFTEEEMIGEIKGSKSDLAMFNMSTDIYVSPCGKFNDQTEKVIREHYKAHRIVEPGFNAIPVTDSYRLTVQAVGEETTIKDISDALDHAQKNRVWVIFMLHQVDSEGGEYSTNSEVLEGMLKLIKQKQLEVILPSEGLSLQ